MFLLDVLEVAQTYANQFRRSHLGFMWILLCILIWQNEIDSFAFAIIITGGSQEMGWNAAANTSPCADPLLYNVSMRDPPPKRIGPVVEVVGETPWGVPADSLSKHSIGGPHDRWISGHKSSA